MCTVSDDVRSLSFFFFNDTATTEIYTLSLHDALPISQPADADRRPNARDPWRPDRGHLPGPADQPSPAVQDRKSTRLNSSHDQISYAVFCLKKKKIAILTRLRSDATRLRLIVLGVHPY